MKLFLFIVIFVFSPVNSVLSKGVFIDPNQQLYDALEVYQLFLTGHSKEEIEAIVQRSLVEENHHQALDIILSLIDKSMPKKGKTDNKICRTSYLPSDPTVMELELDSKKIQAAIKYAYLDYTKFQDPSIESCKLCYTKPNCLSEHLEWNKDGPYTDSEYTSYQTDYQKEFCRQMAMYAQENAEVTPTTALPPSKSSGINFTAAFNTSSRSFSTVRTESAQFAFLYDFSQCQHKQLVCPEVKDTKSFIHPSCLTKSSQHSIQDVETKVSWMNEFSNKIISSCPNFPINTKQIEKLNNKASLFTCFDDDFETDPNASEIINLNLEQILDSNINEVMRKITLKNGSQVEVPMTNFNQERLKLTDEYNQLSSKLKDSDIQLTAAEKDNIELELQKTSESLQELLKAEIASTKYPQDNSYKNELEAIATSLKILERLPKRIPDYGLEATEESIGIGNPIEDFPSDPKTLESVMSILEIKMIQMISSQGRVSERNEKAIQDTAKMWAHDCLKAYYQSLECDTNYPVSRKCSKCPEELKLEDWGDQDSSAVITKSKHSQLFYKGRKCLDYQELIKNVSFPISSKGKACSKDLKLPNKNFIKVKAHSCN